MITKFAPWPPNSGGKRRSLAVLERLARRGEVTLCCFSAEHEDVEELRRRGIDVRAVELHRRPLDVARHIVRLRSITAGRFHDERLARLVRATADPAPDLLMVEYTQLAPYADGVPARLRVLDMHNIESALTSSYARARGPLRAGPYLAEAAALRRMERRIVREFDTVLVVSRTDADRLRRVAPAAAPVVCPNAWEPGPPLPPGTEPVAAMVALMGWAPNVDGATWLGTTIWPLVRAARPDAQLLLVGRAPAPAVRALAGDGIDVTGTVPEVTPFLQRARVALAPLRAGGGSRLKILEALDAGRPVVSTTVGVEGLEDLVGDGVVVADSPQDFAAAVVRLLDDPAEAERLGRRGNAAVRERHSWDAALRPLLDLVPEAT